MTEIAPVVATDTANKPWFDGVDAEVTGYITNRGLDKLDAKGAFLKTVEAHRAAEKLLGAPKDRVLILPRDSGDTEGKNALFTRLGRPEKPEAYDFAAAGQVDDEFKKWAAATYFGLGLTQDQVSGLLRETVKKVTGDTTAAEQRQNAAFEVERQNLLRDWGGRAAANQKIAQDAYKKLGITDEQVKAMESQIGFAKTMSMFLNLGTKLGEDVYIKGEGPAGGVLSREQARDRIVSLKSDQEFVKRYRKGDVEAVKEMTDLHEIAYRDD